LSAHAAQLDQAWLKAGFVFILVGYGTKMGLAPMHTWLPDAHSEAPSPVSALLSGALLNCAFLGILKTYNVLYANGLGEFAGNLLIVFGLLSVLVATAFILKQADYKRMLAYSSIENMGIIAFGTGIGGLAAFGAMLHLVHHSLIKSSLFLTSGNILLGYGTKMIDGTSGLAKSLPATFSAYFAGFLGLTGFPPFGIFLSELLILFGAFQKRYYFSMAMLIILLITIGAGLANYFMRISFGSTSKTIQFRETIAMLLPQFLLLVTSIILCFWIPDSLLQTILESISGIGGGING
jgi:hydrogenase-4 component F